MNKPNPIGLNKFKELVWPDHWVFLRRFKASVHFLRRRTRGTQPSLHTYVRKFESDIQHAQKIELMPSDGNPFHSLKKKGFRIGQLELILPCPCNFLKKCFS
ncbi:MAG: hypothetical protein A2007_04505 [Verrucomicrobia bacterium GWC2_42_7]|nr:MAG: hypothetical protein A2007_04505 [Verrucomicrobia bacterium GWC2_42_7]